MKDVIFFVTMAAIFGVHLLVMSQDSNGALVSIETKDEEEIVADTDSTNKAPSTEVDPDAEPFIPTHDWQKVKAGQSIPSGLHIRMDMQTGEREAKLMEGDDSNKYNIKDDGISMSDGTEPSRLQRMKQNIENALKDLDHGETNPPEDDRLKFWKDADKAGIVNTKTDFFTRDELKEALKKFRANSDDVKDEKDLIKQKFRSADVLKQELEDMNLNMKSDAESIQKLLDMYESTTLTVEDRLEILDDLEYYVHQIDNAQDFTKMGGLLVVIGELNNTDLTIKSAAAFVIGSAVQSNPSVQIQAMESGAMHQLIRLISTETDQRVQNKALYALSALLRQFPYAQQKFVELGGIHTLVNILKDAENVKLKIKTVTLISDLQLERVHAKEQIKQQDGESLREKLTQYNKVKLETALIDQGLCSYIPNLLTFPEHDSVEKVVTVMETLMDSCEAVFYHYTDAIRMLWQLRKDYETLASEEVKDTDTFFRDLHKKIVNVLLRIERYSNSLDL